MKKDMENVFIYTDGSCIDNPGGAGGWAVIILNDSEVIKLSGYESVTTNQRMEMRAVLEALKYCKNFSKKCINIYTDSAYVHNTIMKKWYKNWIKNDWKKSDGESVANKDIWGDIVRLLNELTVVIHKVKGHSTDVLNNECDKMAKNIILFKVFISEKLKSD